MHLVCNAHLDPVWLWEWEEGAAEAVSTFRTAAEICEANAGFVFNHNEAILYQWVEEYEPALFQRIQALVRAGRWHIMGGWYLQPDCNMPAGESFVRQILMGRRYFREKFGVAPTVAINFDPFGHTRGLVQILAKSGYEGYIFCRPSQVDCPLEGDQFVWEGYDGSRIFAMRASGHYNSALGRAHEKVLTALADSHRPACALLLWGVGNHGGGPSRLDVKRLKALIQGRRDVTVRHSTPEAYLADLRRRKQVLPVHRGDLNRWAVGCYTSQVRIKQKHRRLESELFMVEKMASAAWVAGQLPYPAEALASAGRDLAMSQFHDILPGSSIQPVENTSLRLLDHGLETLSRVKARTFFALAAGQPKAGRHRIPVLVYNPHPYPVKAIVEYECQLADQNMSGSFFDITVCRNGRELPTQIEQELSNIPIDWRKRVVFEAELAPSSMNRFEGCLRELPRRPALPRPAPGAALRFRSGRIEAVVNRRTGLLDRLRLDGRDLVRPGAFAALVMRDDEDPWAMHVHGFRRTAGRFRLLSATESAVFAGVRARRLASVRVIEDGDVRCVVEAVFGYGAASRLCLHYKFPKQGTEIEIGVRVLWAEKDRMLKLAVPTPWADARYCGQVAFGVGELPTNGDEVVAQQWTAVVSGDGKQALTAINDGLYGSDCRAGELRWSLLRSPAYSAHPIGDKPRTPQDRFSPRSDQGERCYRFWLNAGPAAERLARVDREAMAHNETPMALSFFPPGGGRPPKPWLRLSDDAVQVTAIRPAEDGRGLMLRLFEPTGVARTTTVTLPAAGLRRRVRLQPFEVKTFVVDLRRGVWRETDLMEQLPVRG